MSLLLPTALVWLSVVAMRFRTSRVVLLSGLVALTGAAFGLILHGDLAPADIGLVKPRAVGLATGLSVGWTLLMLVVSPIADRIATAVFAKPPTLGAFRALQESWFKLAAGIVFAWIAGGFLEELALRGVVLRGLESWLSPHLPGLAAITVAVVAAAAGGFVIHLYQGLRAAFIVAQLSILFGILFVLGGHTLFTQVLAHGLYDTVAFVRFALGRSKYSQLGAPAGDEERGSRPEHS